MKNETTYPNIENFNPESCISGKMRRCSRLVANIFRKHIAQFGITDSQLSILFVSSKIDKLNQKKITEILVLEKSTVNRNITRLLNDNLLAYEPGNILTLTKKGKDLLEKIIPHWFEAMKEIRGVLTEAGEDGLDTILQKLSLVK